MAPSILQSLERIFPSGFFARGSGSVIGLDIGSSAIKVVQLKKKGGKVVLETYGSLSLGPYAGTEAGRGTNLPADKLATAVEDLLREANVTSRDGAVAMPLSSSLISLVSLPALEESKMGEMVPLEARRYIPVPMTEVTLDWWVIPQEESALLNNADGKTGHVDVLLVAILNEALQKYQEVTRLAKLEKAFLEIELFSTVRSVLDQGIQPVMVLDFGASSAKIYLVEHGIVRDSHSINKGSQDITLSISRGMNVPPARAEELKRGTGMPATPEEAVHIREASLLVLDAIFAEARRIMLLFEKRSNKTVGKIVVSGGGSALLGFGDALKARFPDTEIVWADPFGKTVAPAFLEKTLKELGPEFSVAVGLALRKLNQFV